MKRNKGKAPQVGDSFKLRAVENAEILSKRAKDLSEILARRRDEGIKERPTRGYEINGVVGLFAALGAMELVEENISGRLKAVKNGMRDYRGAASALWRSLQRLLASMPDEKVESLMRMKDHLGFRTYLNRQVEQSEEGLCVLRMDDLEVLISASHELCKMCDRDCDACRLGKALDRVEPDSREKGKSWSMMDIGDFNAGSK